jgi:hypothetical protein
LFSFGILCIYWSIWFASAAFCELWLYMFVFFTILNYRWILSNEGQPENDVGITYCTKYSPYWITDTRWAAKGDLRMKLALLIVLSIQIPGAWGIYGGCMSYSTIIEPSGNLKVRIYILHVPLEPSGLIKVRIYYLPP